MKTCYKCRTPKDKSLFSVCKKNPDGLQNRCKVCSAAYHMANKTAHNAYDKARRDTSPADTAAFQKAYREANRLMLRAKAKVYHAANRDKAKIYREANREVIAAKMAVYRAENPDVAELHRAKRRAAKRRAEHENVSSRSIFERDGWICYLCGTPVARDVGYNHPQAPVLDHAIALAKGGTHTADNLMCAHRSCNASKFTRPWWECTIMLQ